MWYACQIFLESPRAEPINFPEGHGEKTAHEVVCNGDREMGVGIGLLITRRLIMVLMLHMLWRLGVLRHLRWLGLMINVKWWHTV